MSDDITDQAERVLRLRWEQPGPDYPEPVPTGLVWLGDWASEHLGELVAELKTTRAQLETLRAGLTRVEHFARIQALSERVRTGPAHSTYHCEERYWLDLLALIERAEVTDV